MKKQIVKKIIEDEYIDISFLSALPSQKCIEDGSVIKYYTTEQQIEEDSICPVINKDGWLLKIHYEKRRFNGELLDKERNRTEERKVKLYGASNNNNNNNNNNNKKNQITDLDIEGIHIAIATMKENETSWFKILPNRHFFPEGVIVQEFTTNEKFVITNSEILLFKIHMNSVQKKDDFDARMDFFETMRLEGNKFFSQKNYLEAFKTYEKGLGIVKNFPKKLKETMTDERKKQFGYYISVLNGNACQCKILFKEWIEAGRYAEASLKGYYQENNVKNLYRKGLCHLNKGEYQMAKENLEKCLKNDPKQNELIAPLLGEVKKHLQQIPLTEKQIYQRVFQNLAEEEEREKKDKKTQKLLEQKKKRLEYEQQEQLQEKVENQLEDYEAWGWGNTDDDNNNTTNQTSESIPLTELLTTGMIADETIQKKIFLYSKKDKENYN